MTCPTCNDIGWDDYHGELCPCEAGQVIMRKEPSEMSDQELVWYFDHHVQCRAWDTCDWINKEWDRRRNTTETGSVVTD